MSSPDWLRSVLHAFHGRPHSGAGADTRRAQAKFVVEAANGPTTPGGDAVLRERGIEVLPDIYTNGGERCGLRAPESCQSMLGLSAQGARLRPAARPCGGCSATGAVRGMRCERTTERASARRRHEGHACSGTPQAAARARTAQGAVRRQQKFPRECSACGMSRLWSKTPERSRDPRGGVRAGGATASFCNWVQNLRGSQRELVYR